MFICNTGTNAATPWYIQIGNVNYIEYFSAKNRRCVGYSPKWLCTEEELLENFTGNIGKQKKKEFIRWLHRSCELSYLDHVLASILEHREHGVKLQVGRNAEDVFTLVPMLYFFALDTKEANELCGVNGAPQSRMRCRLCKCPKDNVNGVHREVRRNGTEMMQLGINGEEAFLRKCEIAKHGRIPDNVRNVLQELKLQSMICIENPLHKYFDWVIDKSLMGIPHCMPYDSLHTLNKGLVESVCKWVVTILNHVGELDPDKYGSNISIMDRRIKSFQTQHSVTPFGKYKNCSNAGGSIERWVLGISDTQHPIIM